MSERHFREDPPSAADLLTNLSDHLMLHVSGVDYVEHSPLQEAIQDIRTDTRNLISTELSAVDWNSRNPLQLEELNQLCHRIELFLRTLPLAELQLLGIEHSEHIDGFGDYLYHTYVEQDLTEEEQADEGLFTSEITFAIPPERTTTGNRLWGQVQLLGRALKRGWNEFTGTSDYQQTLDRGRHCLRERQHIHSHIVNRTLRRFLGQSNVQRADSILGHIVADAEMMEELKEQLSHRVDARLTEAFVLEAQADWKTPMEEVAARLYEEIIPEQLEMLQQSDFADLREQIAEQVVKKLLKKDRRKIQKALREELKGHRGTSAGELLYQTYDNNVKEITTDILYDQNADVIAAIQERVAVCDVNDDLSHTFDDLQTNTTITPLLLVKSMLWAQAETLARSRSKDLKKEAGGVATAIRKDNKVEKGGPLSRMIHRLQRRPHREYLELIAEDIRGIVRRQPKTVDEYTNLLAEVLERPGEDYVQEFIAREAIPYTERSLKDLTREAVRSAEKKLASRQVRRNQVKELLGPEIAEIYRQCWALPPEKRGRKTKRIAKEVFAGITKDTLRNRKENFPDQLSREEADREVLTHVPEMKSALSTAMMNWLASKQQETPLEKKEEWALALLQRDQFEDGDFESLCRDMLNTVREMVRLSRDPTKIVAYFESHLSTDDMERMINYKIGPWARGVVLGNTIPRARGAVQRIMELLKEHAQSIVESNESVFMKMIANKAIAELRVSSVEIFECDIQYLVRELGEQQVLTEDGFAGFVKEPGKFVNIPQLFIDLFAGELNESLVIGGKQVDLERYYDEITSLRANSVTVTRNEKKLLLAVGPFTDEQLKDQYETMARGMGQDIFAHMTTACSGAACRDAPTTFTLPISELLSAADRYGTGAGRLGGGQHMHYQGIVRNRQNNLTAEQYLALAAIGFFNNEKRRFPIPEMVGERMKSEIVHGKETSMHALATAIHVDPQQDWILCEAWTVLNNNYRIAYEKSDTRTCLELDIVRQKLLEDGHRMVHLAELQYISGGGAMLRKLRNTIKREAGDKFKQLSSLYRTLHPRDDLPTLTIQETNPEQYIVLIKLPMHIAKDLDPETHDDYDDQLWMLEISGQETLTRMKPHLEPEQGGYTFKDQSLFVNEGPVTPEGVIDTLFGGERPAGNTVTAHVLPTPSMWQGARMMRKQTSRTSRHREFAPGIRFVGEFEPSDDPFGFDKGSSDPDARESEIEFLE